MKNAKEYIVFPLDVPSADKAKQLVELLADYVGMFKIGLELFIQSGADLIQFIQTKSPAKIFLDLKLHDIPVTVERAMQRIAEMGVALTTVHCGESVSMLEAAVEGSKGKVGVLGVTILTSVSQNDIQQAGFIDEYSTDMTRLIVKRAAMAKSAGCTGVVCSGQEVGMIKEEFGNDFIAVTPGIRPAGDAVKQDDQSRITTPAQAVRSGADYIVIGRPIRDAADPQKAAGAIAAEIQTVLNK